MSSYNPLNTQSNVIFKSGELELQNLNLREVDPTVFLNFPNKTAGVLLPLV
jgi:hypothetical protein